VLEGCPDVRILATSREPLRAPGERQYRVLPLAVPRADRQSVLDELASCASVQLFVERAEAFSPGFALNEANARLVGDICLRLEGIPLAIELAAGRVRVLALEQIRDRLDDCFRLLSGGGQTMPRRQQTLRRDLEIVASKRSVNQACWALVRGLMLWSTSGCCMGCQRWCSEVR
jgi:predicted ATPase